MKLTNLKNKKMISARLGLFWSSSTLKNPDKVINKSIRKMEKGKRIFYYHNKNSGMSKALKTLKTVFEKDLDEIDKTILQSTIKGKSYIINAKQHVDANYVFMLDFKSFFNQITSTDITKYLIEKYSMAKDAAMLISKICTYNVDMPEARGKRVIPQGYPTSPILSFLARKDAFREIKKALPSLNISLYVDDLTISSVNNIDKKTRSQIINILLKHHILINFEKTNYLSTDSPIDITGVIIKNKKIYAPFKFFKKRRMSKKDVYDGINAQIRHIKKINEK